MTSSRIFNFIFAHRYLIIPLACLAYYLIYFNYGIVLDDEGFLTWNAASILHDQWPVSDFMSYQPFMYFALAGFFRLFGETLVTERLFLLIPLLISIECLIWCGSALLPPRLAVLPALFFAFAPGPWYKVFFVFHLLLTLVAALRFTARPDARRGLWFGLATGFAIASRAEAGMLCAVLFGAALALELGARLVPPRPAVGATLALAARTIATFVVGAAAPVLLLLGAYGAAGKLGSLIGNTVLTARYAYRLGIESLGRAAVFAPGSLVRAPSLEQWFFAIGLAAALFVLLANLPGYLHPDRDQSLPMRRKVLTAGLALASMSYSYFYVWDSRMLSTFAIVYLAEIVLLSDMAGWVERRRGHGGTAALGAGLAVLLAFIGIFCRTAIYSGSISARLPPVVAIDHPFLRGSYVYRLQEKDITGLMSAAAAKPGGTIVPLSESTTMAYLSGLDDPTYYRLFTGELAPPGAEDQAIATFDRLKIDFFVARSGQFVPGGATGSDLARYAPEVKRYLLAHYEVEPLGERYVLLRRKAAS